MAGLTKSRDPTKEYSTDNWKAANLIELISPRRFPVRNLRLRCLSAIPLVLALSAARAADSTALARLTVAELVQSLAGAAGESDATTTKRLQGFELTERLSPELQDRLAAKLPGEKSRQQLAILAGYAAFLAPPASEIPTDPSPSPEEASQILSKVVNYIAKTTRQLPNFLATREVTSFEDRPQENRLTPDGAISLSAQPMHYMGRSSNGITFRDNQETVDNKSSKSSQGSPGLLTSGEFGPILATVVRDAALNGKIQWARWQRGPAGTEAVFRFEVPDGKSNYHVRFCCTSASVDGRGELFDEKEPYHGEIVANPADGSVISILVRADLQPTELVSAAGMVVDYGPVDLGGKNYICPKRSYSLLSAHLMQQGDTQSRSSYKGAPTTFLNRTEFTGYRRFGAEARILSDSLPDASSDHNPTQRESRMH
ncbi:MAG: hypothetical protein ABSF23_13695 [Terracidiphilus sp.]|jgi:hypothetical protein